MFSTRYVLAMTSRDADKVNPCNAQKPTNKDLLRDKDSENYFQEGTGYNLSTGKSSHRVAVSLFEQHQFRATTVSS